MDETLTWLGQFGVAGLVAWMWLAERRASAVRERQLTEAHGRLMIERQETEVLLRALNDNTRALASLEASQRGLLGALGRAIERGLADGAGRRASTDPMKASPSSGHPEPAGRAGERGVGRSA